MSPQPAETHQDVSPLNRELQYFKGVGPKRAEKFARLGLRVARDVLFFFPRDYQELATIVPLDELVEDQECSLVGRIQRVQSRTTRRGLFIVTARVFDDSGARFDGVWFNQPYLQQKLFEDQRVLLSGKAKKKDGKWQLSNPKFLVLKDDELPPAGEVLPVYPLTEGLSQYHVRKVVDEALEFALDSVEEVLPEQWREDHGVAGIHDSIRAMHHPDDLEQQRQARGRFALQELFVLQLALGLRRRRLEAKQQAPRLPVDAKIHARICRLFPFDLTADQQQAIKEITEDMAGSVPMNRLLQGDVGTGKTVVAVYAMLLAAAHGHQAVLMAPTEILAQQHAKTLKRLLTHSRVRCELLTGSCSAGERRQLLEDLGQGEIDLLVGTQAVISEGVEFQRLGLVIIDEQHKFGVKQRAGLRQSGRDPHYLVMTATPIPRTLTMTAFGDLEVSTLKQGPPDRQKVHSYLGTPETRESWWEFVREKLREGRQAYVVTPWVDPSETTDFASVKEVFEELSHGPLSEFRVDLLHGKLRPDEKREAMFRFATGDTQVLVATSVVEVGVDVPNATVMTIESGERFGLSQLHQLRGRVSRGVYPGFVCVFHEPDNEACVERLKAFIATTDGFRLAEDDFRFRGPGDMLGIRQHGLPPLKVADLLQDQDVVVEARRLAQATLAADPELEDPVWSGVKRQVLRRYGQVLELGDVG